LFGAFVREFKPPQNDPRVQANLHYFREDMPDSPLESHLHNPLTEFHRTLGTKTRIFGTQIKRTGIQVQNTSATNVIWLRE
jgi:hypothetical protein